MANHKKYYKGEGGGFPPSLGCDESCESVYANGSSMHQKCVMPVCTASYMMAGYEHARHIFLG